MDRLVNTLLGHAALSYLFPFLFNFPSAVPAEGEPLVDIDFQLDVVALRLSRETQPALRCSVCGPGQRRAARQAG